LKHGADILFAWFLSLAVGLQIKSLTLLDPEDWDYPTADSLVSYFQRFGGRLEFLAIWPHRASFNGNDISFWIIPTSWLIHRTIRNTQVCHLSSPSQVVLPACSECPHHVTRPALFQLVHSRNRALCGFRQGQGGYRLKHGPRPLCIDRRGPCSSTIPFTQEFFVGAVR
jgi:hypothetical protein